MPLKALIFDVDGTLAETEELHRAAFNAVFAAHGLSWNWDQERYRALLKVTGGRERMRAFAADVGETLSDGFVAALHREKTLRYVDLLHEGAVALRPGIEELIGSARAAGLDLAIATTTSRPNVEALVRVTLGEPADKIFSVIAAGDDVAHKKPAPDVYTLALSKLNLAAPRCIALEDSLNGLRSARGAGLGVIVSPGLYTRDECFPGAISVLDSFEAVSNVRLLENILREGFLQATA